MRTLSSGAIRIAGVRSILADKLVYLIDTNVVSELGRKRPSEAVLQFWRVNEPSSALSVLTFGELRKGAAAQSRKDEGSAAKLSMWIDRIEAAYTTRTLPVDLAIATIWGKLSGDRTRPTIDTLLAATAIHHGLTLVTRNTRDVEDTTVPLLNPWEL